MVLGMVQTNPGNLHAVLPGGAGSAQPVRDVPDMNWRCRNRRSVGAVSDTARHQHGERGSRSLGERSEGRSNQLQGRHREGARRRYRRADRLDRSQGAGGVHPGRRRTKGRRWGSPQASGCAGRRADGRGPRQHRATSPQMPTRRLRRPLAAARRPRPIRWPPPATPFHRLLARRRRHLRCSQGSRRHLQPQRRRPQRRAAGTSRSIRTSRWPAAAATAAAECPRPDGTAAGPDRCDGLHRPTTVQQRHGGRAGVREPEHPAAAESNSPTGYRCSSFRPRRVSSASRSKTARWNTGRPRTRTRR